MLFSLQGCGGPPYNVHHVLTGVPQSSILGSFITFLNDITDVVSSKKSHEIEARNNLCLLKLPKIRTEYARKSFRFTGAKIYIELPTEIRRSETFYDFVKLLKKHFS